MISLYDLLNILNLHCELEIFDFGGYLLQEGCRGDTMWEESLLDRRVYTVLPGIVTKIYLDEEN